MTAPAADGPATPPGGEHPERVTVMHLRGLSSRIGVVSRRTALWSVLLLATAWLVLVFGTALSGVNAADQRLQEVRVANAELQERVDGGRAEIERIQTDPFLRMQARAYGMGERGEQAFGLQPGTPLMDPVVPLGSEPDAAVSRTPLEEWFALLFGGRS